MLGLVVPTHAWLLPLFVQFRTLGLLDRRITLVLPYVTFALPTAIFLIESFVRSIPEEMEESATMEGCGVWQSLFRIILPLCKPMLATIMILTFNSSWNEFPFALVLINRDALKTVPVALTMFTGTYTTKLSPAGYGSDNFNFPRCPVLRIVFQEDYAGNDCRSSEGVGYERTNT